MSQVAQMSHPTSRQRVTTNINNEPAITIGTLTGLANAGLILLFAFVTGFSTEQQAAIMAFATAVVAVIGALVTRTQVSPVSKVAAKLETAHAVGQAGETLQVEA
jgi:hypothetical protein